MTEIDPEADLDALEAGLDECEAIEREAGATLDDAAPEVSGWSPAQHLYHVALATDLALGNAVGLVRGSSSLAVEGREPNELALQLFALGRFPRGRAEAPRMVRPPERVERALLHAELERCRSSLAGAREVATRLAGAPRRIPHQLLGALDAVQWAHFARLHTDHHLAIVRDVRRALERGA